MLSKTEIQDSIYSALESVIREFVGVVPTKENLQEIKDKVQKKILELLPNLKIVVEEILYDFKNKSFSLNLKREQPVFETAQDVYDYFGITDEAQKIELAKKLLDGMRGMRERYH